MAQLLSPGDLELAVRIGRFLVVLLVGLFLTRTIGLPMVRRLAPRKDKKTISTYQNMAGVVGIFASLSVALQAGRFGSLLTIFGTVTAALTVAVGFGMREEVGNFVSGIFIRLNTPFVEEDYIATEKVEGTVKEISLRDTRLRGPRGEKVMVPNSHLGNSAVHNRTRDRTTVRSITMQAPPESAEDLKEVMREAAAATEEIFDDPEPEVSFIDMEDEKVRLELLYSLRDSGNARQIRDTLLDRILEQGRERGLFTGETEAA